MGHGLVYALSRQREFAVAQRFEDDGFLVSLQQAFGRDLIDRSQ
jgi:hypothetical protein